VAFGSTGLFVTGTDTGVGKTAVAESILRELVARGRSVGAYKPVASGVGPSAAGSDPELLWLAAGRPRTLTDVCPQAFAAAIAPADAARAEGREIDEGLLRSGFAAWRDGDRFVVVEGAGGLFSPLSDATLNVDLAREFGLPLVIVDSGRLGAIGRVLGTFRAARAEGLAVAAVVLSHVEPLDERVEEPESAWRVADAARQELVRRLAPIPVAVLRHGSSSIEPKIDCHSDPLALRERVAEGRVRVRRAANRGEIEAETKTAAKHPHPGPLPEGEGA